MMRLFWCGECGGRARRTGNSDQCLVYHGKRCCHRQVKVQRSAFPQTAAVSFSFLCFFCCCCITTLRLAPSSPPAARPIMTHGSIETRWALNMPGGSINFRRATVDVMAPTHTRRAQHNTRAVMSSAGAGCGLQTRRRVALAAVRFGLRGEQASECYVVAMLVPLASQTYAIFSQYTHVKHCFPLQCRC